MNQIFKTISIFFVGLFFVPQLTLANISVSPLIIDHNTEARDILTKDITIKNHGGKNLRLFASVHEIEIDGNNEIKSFIPASMSDRTKSVTSWIEINRGRIELKSQDEIKVPLTVRINPNAESGKYHAFVGFAQATNRDEAEAKIKNGQASGVIVRINIDDKKRELLRLVSFNTDNLVFEEGRHNFSFTLENAGDVPLSPGGEIIIYDSKGMEIDTVDLTNKIEAINPGEKKDFTELIPYGGKIGKNKAFLSLEYGQSQRAVVHDTNFYYSVPWLYLIIMILLIVGIPLIITILLRRMFKSDNDDVYSDEGNEVPLFVKKSHDHEIHDHDIDLRKKDS